MIERIVRLLALLLALGTAVSATGSNAAQAASHRTSLASSSPEPTAAAAQPKPLRGVPLTGSTGLRLLIANNPPLLFDVDTGRITRISGVNVRGNAVLSVLAVGKHAIIWLDRSVSTTKVPSAEIYVVRHGTTRATRLATAWDVAPSPDGAAVWLKSDKDARHCTLREVALNGRQRRSPRPVPCSGRLVDVGGGALFEQAGSVVDPQTDGRCFALAGSGLWPAAL